MPVRAQKCLRFVRRAKLVRAVYSLLSTSAQGLNEGFGLAVSIVFPILEGLKPYQSHGDNISTH